VKYARDFSKFFDLIAERRSAVFHLRELGKACVLAKFLLETSASLDEWACENFNESAMSTMLHPVVPQVWNVGISKKRLTVRDGVIVDTDEATGAVVHNIYGGVQFGLDMVPRIPLVKPAVEAAVPAVPKVMPDFKPVPAATTPGTGAAPAAPGAAPPGQGQVVPPGMEVRPKPTSRVVLTLGKLPSVPGKGDFMKAMPLPARPLPLGERLYVPARGVDLGLQEFNLSEPSHLALQGGPIQASNPVSFSPAFWKQLDVDNTLEHVDMLRSIYDGALSDRRSENDTFVPVETTATYVEKLRRLVLEERALADSSEKAVHPEADEGLASERSPPEDGRPSDGALVQKVLEYVELSRTSRKRPQRKMQRLECHYFAVVETTNGERTCTERCLSTGKPVWDSCSQGLEARMKAAKLVRQVNCSTSGLVVADFRRSCVQESLVVRSGGHRSQSKQYARCLGKLACSRCQRTMLQPEAPDMSSKQQILRFPARPAVGGSSQVAGAVPPELSRKPKFACSLGGTRQSPPPS